MGSMVSTVIANLHIESYRSNRYPTSEGSGNAMYMTFTILVRENADSLLQHLRNRKHSIHFTDVTNSNNTLAINSTAKIKSQWFARFPMSTPKFTSAEQANLCK